MNKYYFRICPLKTYLANPNEKFHLFIKAENHAQALANISTISTPTIAEAQKANTPILIIIKEDRK